MGQTALEHARTRVQVERVRTNDFSPRARTRGRRALRTACSLARLAANAASIDVDYDYNALRWLINQYARENGTSARGNRPHVAHARATATATAPSQAPA